MISFYSWFDSSTVDQAKLTNRQNLDPITNDGMHMAILQPQAQRIEIKLVQDIKTLLKFIVYKITK